MRGMPCLSYLPYITARGKLSPANEAKLRNTEIGRDLVSTRVIPRGLTTLSIDN